MTGLWLVGTNGTAHFFPGILSERAGVHSACHRWLSTTEDHEEGPMTLACPECKEHREREAL
jgi:hypothetical protein